MKIQKKPSFLLFLLFILTGIQMASGQHSGERVLFHYLKISKALSRSDFKSAEVQARSLSEECRKTGLSSLVETSNQLRKTSGLVEFREKFSPFSDSLFQIIQSGKLVMAEELYLVHCPMAFNDRGADWISDVPKVINPYFGDEMLHCGKVKTNIRANSK